MAGTYQGTTHSSPHNGHGRTVPRQRFAIPVRGLVKGQPARGKFAPWFLREWGARPETKRTVVVMTAA